MFRFLFQNLPLLFQIAMQIFGLSNNTNTANEDTTKSLDELKNRTNKLTDEVRTLKAKNTRLENEISTMKMTAMACLIIAVVALVVAIIAIIK